MSKRKYSRFVLILEPWWYIGIPLVLMILSAYTTFYVHNLKKNHYQGKVFNEVYRHLCEPIDLGRPECLETIYDIDF